MKIADFNNTLDITLTVNELSALLGLTSNQILKDKAAGHNDALHDTYLQLEQYLLTELVEGKVTINGRNKR